MQVMLVVLGCLQTQKELAHVAIALSKDPNATPPAVGNAANLRAAEGGYAPPSLRGSASVRAALLTGQYYNLGP